MLHNKTFLAIIPARGGSKRLPKKNILPLNGKPLISWTVEAAKESKYLDCIVVTSDDTEILSIAETYKVKTLQRPEILADDEASTISVIEHVIENFPNYKYIVLLQPTSPLRRSDHIDAAIELLEVKNADAIISVCEMEHSPLWANTLPKDKSMKNFLPEELLNVRSQDLDKFYRLNGAIYICKIEKFMKEKKLFLSDKIFAFIMDKESSIDIDDKGDFKLAQYYCEQMES